MKKLLIPLLLFVAVSVFGQNTPIAPRAQKCYLDTVVAVDVTPGSGIQTITRTLAQATTDSIWVPFPGSYDMHIWGFVSIEITPGAAMDLSMIAFPAQGTYTTSMSGTEMTETVTMRQSLTIDVNDALDTLKILPWDGTGTTLVSGQSYTIPIDAWTSGTAHPWGPCRGLLIKFQKSDASAETLAITAVYAQ